MAENSYILAIVIPEQLCCNLRLGY